MRTALGLFALCLMGCSGRPPFAPAEVIIENNLAIPVIVELADGRAWEVPPDGWGPTVQVEPGTHGTIYTADCVPIKEVMFERNGGFIVNLDGVREFSFSDIVTTTVEHAGCT
jgi:hypothetical protein